MNRRGLSLIELLLVVCLATGIAVTVSIAFSSASKNIILNRQGWTAANLANSQIQSIKSKPYAFVDPTPDASFSVSNTTCDCSQEPDFTNFGSTPTIVSSMTYFVASCVNYVTPTGGNNMSAQCSATPPGDTGYKNVFVKVSWTNGTSSSTVVQETFLTRY